MLGRKNYKTRVKTTALPTEIWLIIFDIVIEDEIIWLGQCDYTTFPHVTTLLYTLKRPYPFYDSYWRLRLVCRRFNTLLNSPPWQAFSDSSLLPLPISTRALYLNLRTLSEIHFHRLLSETSTCGHLVSIDVECFVTPCHFLRPCAGRPFPNVQRLILRCINIIYSLPEGSFWTLLNRAFPFLVTLAVITELWDVAKDPQSDEADEAVCFERLEILYFSHTITYLGCNFPRLRHASIRGCSLPELEILTRSSHLESLLIRSNYLLHHNIDVTSCLRLKLLGLPHWRYIGMVPLGPDHPLEQIRIYSTNSLGNPELFKQLSRLPKISRITVEVFSICAHHEHRIHEFREMRLESFGLIMRPFTATSSGCGTLIIERADTSGIMGKVWRKMRR